MTQAQDWRVYIGTYTNGASKGIYSYRYNEATGALTDATLAVATVSPSFLAAHPFGRTMYAVNESRRYNGLANSGSVSAFTLDHSTGLLTLLNTVPSLGADPCHLVVDATGHWVLVANYSGGSVAVFPIREDGSLGEASQLLQFTGAAKVDPVRQEAAHAHSVDLSPDNKFLYVSDLGNDQIVVYNFDAAKGKLALRAATKLTPGSGPRHIAFSRDRRYLYSFSELSATVTTFRHDAATAGLEELQTVSTLPPGNTSTKSGAEIAVDPSGRFLYASNRGDDSIAIFSIDAEQGRLTRTGQVSTRGKTPRHFAIDAAGGHLIAANQDSSTIAIFEMDGDSGALKAVGDLVVAPEVVCVLFVRLT
ncbi:MAG: lactonase family protein [Acidobacteriota bacterium]